MYDMSMGIGISGVVGTMQRANNQSISQENQAEIWFLLSRSACPRYMPLFLDDI